MRLVQKYYSRHTPKHLEEYANLDDDSLSKMSRGEKLMLLEDEADKAERNTNKYKWRKIKEHAAIGASAGAGVGLLGGPIGSAIGAGVGGIGGAITGAIRGKSKAKKEGHSAGEVSETVARKLDEYAKAHNQEDDFRYNNRRGFRGRRIEKAVNDVKRQQMIDGITSGITLGSLGAGVAASNGGIRNMVSSIGNLGANTAKNAPGVAMSGIEKAHDALGKLSELASSEGAKIPGALSKLSSLGSSKVQ